MTILAIIKNLREQDQPVTGKVLADALEALLDVI